MQTAVRATLLPLTLGLIKERPHVALGLPHPFVENFRTGDDLGRPRLQKAGYLPAQTGFLGESTSCSYSCGFPLPLALPCLSWSWLLAEG